MGATVSESPVAILYDSSGTEKGTAANPVKVDPTGTTAQPVSGTVTANAGTGPWPVTDNSGSLTTDTPQLPAALVGARLDTNAGAWLGSTAPTVGQKAMAAAVPVVIASDQSPIPVTVAPGNATPGLVFGNVATSSITTVPVRKTTYTEQATNAQRSIASASANDASAGTGAQQVKVTYYDQTGAGPYTETLTLNGTAGVNTVATNICFIEKMEVVRVGSGGVNAGIITLYSAISKGGVAVGTIAVGDNRTLWALHYVPAGKTGHLTELTVNNTSSTVGNGASFFIRAYAIGVSGAPDLQVCGLVRAYGQSSQVTQVFGTPLAITGPARVQVWVTTEGSGSVDNRAALDFYDE